MEYKLTTNVLCGARATNAVSEEDSVFVFGSTTEFEIIFFYRSLFQDLYLEPSVPIIRDMGVVCFTYGLSVLGV